MKPLHAQLTNFGSYPSLEFNFDSQGLALVFGATGSGKSTLLDVIPWCLFGQTAKGGKADDIRSWDASGDTVGHLTVALPDGTIEVTRIRGVKNDLYYTEEGSPDREIRGKDLQDTQKILNQRLRTDFDSFAAGSYICSASPSETFYVAPAKARRELFEKITDLSLPAKLTERVQNAKKTTKKNQADIQTAYDRAAGKVDSIGTYLERVASDSDTWDRTHTEKLQKLQVLKDNFDKEKASKIEVLRTKAAAIEQVIQSKINKLSEKVNKLAALIKPNELMEFELKRLKRDYQCTECGGVKGSGEKTIDAYVEKIYQNHKMITDKENLEVEIACLAVDEEEPPHIQAINNALTLENHYTEQLAEELYRENPYEAQWKRLSDDWAKANEEYLSTGKSLSEVTRKYKALTHLQDLASDLRGALLKSSVSQIEAKTNDILQTYFDGAFRVGFTVSGDDLDISIQKSGHECTYLQLSKGQRRLLTLSFSVTIMEATANNLGIHFDCLMIDEGFDGCDAELKTAGYVLLEELASKHSTVLVIDHSTELKNQFDKKFLVEMVGDHSELEEE